MRLVKLGSIAFSALFLGGCAEPTALTSPILGYWVEILAPSDNLSPRQLMLGPDASFQLVVTLPDGYTRTEGSFTISGSTLAFTPTRLVNRSGGNTREVVTPYAWGSIFDDCEFELVGDELRLHYTTYPFDGPVPTTMRFARLRQ